MKDQQQEIQFVICVDNTDYPAALERRKIYQAVPDAQASQHHLLRVIDESGEDYLYPEHYFVFVSLPLNVQEVLLRAA